MPLLNLGERSLYWRTDGDPSKTPLLLLNSLGTDHSMWNVLMPELLKDFHVLRMDKRGHGGSSNVTEQCSIAELGRDVLAVLDAAKWPRTHLCGVSIGGMTGMWLGLNAPERLDHLVLSNTSAKVVTEVFADRIKLIKDKGLQAIVDQALGRFFTQGFVTEASPAYHSIREVFLQCDPGGYIACCTAIRDMDQRQDIAGIKLPTMVIIGDQDQSTVPAMGEQIVSQIAGASVERMPLAHIPMIEDPKSYVQILRKFLLGT
ncbi:3-oxoadipate enol-lactonase [Orrella marina]|uniref:3-oxoadipate enol-lactonase n=1 Tax=Orrella marina TaxID=2163011 RepID=A0A2R4XKN6_9BURK|nr:3-oxoadipate enol-lactonase [Orrella marina]AWB34382.1 3-oxoadipate enol-lactonase [Orrella marina]